MNPKPSQEKKKERIIKRILLSAVGFLMVGSLFVYKENHHRLLSTQLFEAEHRRASLLNEESHLKLKYAKISEYTRIVALAKSKLGMVPIGYVVDTLRVNKTENYQKIIVASIVPWENF